MRAEVIEIPDAVARLLSLSQPNIEAAAELVRAANPSMFLSVARGSSDHACTFLKYASELILRRPMATVGPSVSSVYGVELQAPDAVCISISQSGQSPDIVRMTESLRANGTPTIALTNDATSRLAKVSDTTLSIHAGAELSVAATKTFVTSLVAGLWLIAEIKQDGELLAAIRNLPGRLSSRWDGVRPGPSPTRPRLSSRKPASFTPRAIPLPKSCMARFPSWTRTFLLFHSLQVMPPRTVSRKHQTRLLKRAPAFSRWPVARHRQRCSPMCARTTG